jgi:hypothetical protein
MKEIHFWEGDFFLSEKVRLISGVKARDVASLVKQNENGKLNDFS